MVRLEKISKSFGKQQVLRDVSLAIGEGEIVGLLGPNGAGKSTLMKIVIGLWKADSGQVTAPRRIGYLPERNPLYEEMYVREYLQFMERMTEDGKSKKQGLASRLVGVDELIARVGLTAEAHKKIGQLSKGYRQRVGLAQALLGEPEMLILDEPTTGLDPNQLVEIRELIRTEGKQRTIILSTHILQEVQEVCSRVVILDHGVVKADKPIGEIENLEETFRKCTC
ncbi:MAG: ATP-binding cassette domain-containing protein [Paludibacteraceae bacterium]